MSDLPNADTFYSPYPRPKLLDTDFTRRLSLRVSRYPLPRFACWMIWEDGSVHPLLDRRLKELERWRDVAEEVGALLNHAMIVSVLAPSGATPEEQSEHLRTDPIRDRVPGIYVGLRSLPEEVLEAMREGEMATLSYLCGWSEIRFHGSEKGSQISYARAHDGTKHYFDDSGKLFHVEAPAVMSEAEALAHCGHTWRYKHPPADMTAGESLVYYGYVRDPERLEGT